MNCKNCGLPIFHGLVGYAVPMCTCTCRVRNTNEASDNLLKQKQDKNHEDAMSKLTEIMRAAQKAQRDEELDQLRSENAALRTEIEAASAQEPVAAQWRNIKSVVRSLADWAFGSADDPKWGSAWIAMVNGLTCKDGPDFKLEPICATPPDSAARIAELEAEVSELQLIISTDTGTESAVATLQERVKELERELSGPTREQTIQWSENAGFYFHDAGYAPILHSLPEQYSEKCFERLVALAYAAGQEAERNRQRRFEPAPIETNI